MPARAAAQAIAAGISRIDAAHEVVLCPIADGGEGTIEAIIESIGGSILSANVTGPLGEMVDSRWAIINDLGIQSADTSNGLPTTAIIEIAEAAGIQLIEAQLRDPTKTTTYGVGELINRALDAGCKTVIAGLGGSATCDGGTGMAQALGATLIMSDNEVLNRPVTGGDLKNIKSINPATMRPEIKNTKFIVACDVTNPLYGPTGSAYVFAPQKGADSNQVILLDEGLRNLAALLADKADPTFAGAGSAGGFGYGFVVFCNAQIKKGIDLVLDTIKFEQIIQDADLIITGEGQIDQQTLDGKAVYGVAKAGKKAGIPVIALVGSVGRNAHMNISPKYGGLLTAYHSLTETGCTIEQAKSEPEKYMAKLAENVIKRYLSKPELLIERH